MVLVAVVAVAATSVAAVVILLSQPEPSAPAEVTLDRVEIAADRASIDQRETVVLRATAIDSEDADRTGEAQFTWSELSTDRVGLTPQGSNVSILGVRPGTATLRGSATWKNATRSATVNITVAGLHFELAASDPAPLVNAPVDLTVRVLRSSGLATTYRGTVNLTSDAPLAVALPADGTFTPSDGGTKTFPGLRVLTHGTVLITARDTLTPIEGAVAVRGRATPHADFIVEDSQRTGADIRLSVDASASDDPDGSIGLYNWTWGDGGVSETAAPRTSHVFNASREDQAVAMTLRVTDNEGFSDSVSRSVLVTLRPYPPVALFTATDPDSLSWYVSVDASGSSDPNGNLVYFNWTWGDGRVTDGTDPTVRHRYSAVGSYTINLTVEDSTSLRNWSERIVDVRPRPFSIDYTFYDFFGVPYDDFWDFRSQNYYELPVNAECFHANSIVTGECVPSNSAVPDVMSYPYMHYYSPGTPGNPDLIPSIWAPYRMRVNGVNVSGYTLAEPVILPVFDATQGAGQALDFDWYMQYVGQTRSPVVELACATNFVFGNDGYIVESQVTATMDLQESRRLFGVIAATPDAAAAWWAANTDADCAVRTPFEVKVQNWFIKSGGSQINPGKYDIINGYEWYYQGFGTNVTATVDPDGTTHVRMDHFAWGTEALMGRWLYWGNASYKDNALNSTRREGWWGMEQSWFEDFNYGGHVRDTSLDFTLSTTVQYHLQELCSPGPNGLYDRQDDVSFWQWGPFLLDYVDDFYSTHLVSELDRMPGATYVHCAPGQPASAYGQNLEYDYTPVTWDLKPGETWHFQLPSGDIVVHDPNLTPAGADPRLMQFAEVRGPLELWNSKPAGYGEWDPVALTWDVIGPSATGGPEGSTGPDGLPGTIDDLYAMEPWPQINFLVHGTQPAPALQEAARSPSRASGSALDAVVSASVEWAAILPRFSDPIVGEGVWDAAARSALRPFRGSPWESTGRVSCVT